MSVCGCLFGCVVVLHSDNVLGSLAVAYFRAHALIAADLPFAVVVAAVVDLH